MDVYSVHRGTRRKLRIGGGIGIVKQLDFNWIIKADMTD